AHILHVIYALAVRFEPAVGNAENQLALEYTLDVHAVDDLPHGREHLLGKLDLADAQGAAASRQTEPAEEESGQLPKRIEPETTGHHRIAFEVTIEKPKRRLDIVFGSHFAF